MTALAHERCIICHAGLPRAEEAEIRELHAQIPEWSLVERGGIARLERTYHLRDFAQALAFTARLGELAEGEGHHPIIHIEYGQVTVSWWTHAIHWLHRNDFIMAAKTDQIARALAGAP
jgi:4a-hydroxytetrahydrobiopterin dehydratase